MSLNSETLISEIKNKILELKNRKESQMQSSNEPDPFTNINRDMLKNFVKNEKSILSYNFKLDQDNENAIISSNKNTLDELRNIWNNDISSTSKTLQQQNENGLNELNSIKFLNEQQQPNEKAEKHQQSFNVLQANTLNRENKSTVQKLSYDFELPFKERDQEKNNKLPLPKKVKNNASDALSTLEERYKSNLNKRSVSNGRVGDLGKEFINYFQPSSQSGEGIKEKLQDKSFTNKCKEISSFVGGVNTATKNQQYFHNNVKDKIQSMKFEINKDSYFEINKHLPHKSESTQNNRYGSGNHNINLPTNNNSKNIFIADNFILSGADKNNNGLLLDKKSNKDKEKDNSFLTLQSPFPDKEYRKSSSLNEDKSNLEEIRKLSAKLRFISEKEFSKLDQK
jgi:hypothetical protein